MKKTLAAIALIGVAGVAQAAPATLVSVTSESSNGAAAWNIKASTATWDLTGGTATQTGGTYSGFAKAGPTLLMTHTMTNGVLSSGAASATSWACIEGLFGGVVGAHICGNYNFGANFSNQSTYTPTATGATVTLGGDDVALGVAQTLGNSYSNLVLSYVGVVGANDRWKLSNAIPSVTGYTFTFDTAVAVVPVPAAVWLFGSALGLMGAMRRRSAV